MIIPLLRPKKSIKKVCSYRGWRYHGSFVFKSLAALILPFYDTHVIVYHADGFLLFVQCHYILCFHIIVQDVKRYGIDAWWYVSANGVVVDSHNHLFGTRPLSETMLTYGELDLYEQSLVKFESKQNSFRWVIWFWKCFLQHFVYFAFYVFRAFPVPQCDQTQLR